MKWMNFSMKTWKEQLHSSKRDFDRPGSKPHLEYALLQCLQSHRVYLGQRSYESQMVTSLYRWWPLPNKTEVNWESLTPSQWSTSREQLWEMNSQDREYACQWINQPQAPPLLASPTCPPSSLLSHGQGCALLQCPWCISYFPSHSHIFTHLLLIAAASVNMLNPHFLHFALSLLPSWGPWKNWSLLIHFLTIHTFSSLLGGVQLGTHSTSLMVLNPSSLYFFVIGAGNWVISLVFLVLAKPDSGWLENVSQWLPLGSKGPPHQLCLPVFEHGSMRMWCSELCSHLVSRSREVLNTEPWHTELLEHLKTTDFRTQDWCCIKKSVPQLVKSLLIWYCYHQLEAFQSMECVHFYRWGNWDAVNCARQHSHGTTWEPGSKPGSDFGGTAVLETAHHRTECLPGKRWTQTLLSPKLE